MQLRNPVFYWLSLFFAILTLPLFAQDTEVQDADLADPVETADELVPKGAVYVNITDEELRERLSQLSGCLELKVHPVVKSYIRTYVQLKTEKTKTMLGKRLTYFPLFEDKFREHGVPLDLKYLSVVESALNPKAVSRVGATGLWQFMPYTGKDYGLNTSSTVEDRSDPVKSTDAAARYLKALYNQFDDWALALAAYNSGPGRVNSAIKRAHSRNFWNIQRYLPKETRNYVPAFIAATYICNFFQLHGLQPDDPDLDEQITRYIKVYEALSFKDIADATGVEYATVKSLNPGFRRDYVPPSTDGYYVILPERVMPAFVRYLNSLGNRTYALEGADYNSNANIGDGRYWHTLINVQQAELVEVLAQKHGCSADHLKAWNGLTSNYVYSGQVLKVWHPVYVQKHSSIRIEAPGNTSRTRRTEPAKSNNSSASGNTSAPASMPGTVPSGIREQVNPLAGQYQYHTVRRNESLDDIARQYATSVESLRKLNNLTELSVGMRLKIRQY